MNRLKISAIAVAVAVLLGACGEIKDEQKVPSTDPNTFAGTFFSMIKPAGTNPSTTGSNVAFNGEKMTVLVNVTQIPGIEAGNLDSVKSVLATDNTAYENVSTSEAEINGIKGVKFEGSLSGRKVAGWAFAIADAIVTVKHVPFDDPDGKLTEAYDASLASFKVTNPDYFKGAPVTPSVENPQATPGDISNTAKPETFENDYMKFTIPRNWESSSTNSESIMLSPMLENTTDAGQGVTIDVMDRHTRSSDLEYAQTHGSKAVLKTYGKTEFATFSIAQAGIQVFIVSSKDKTFMINVSTPSDTLSKKIEEFLGSVVIK